MKHFKKWIRTLSKVLETVEAGDDSAAILEAEIGFDRLLAKTLEARQKNATIFLIGNGASASMASHVAADLSKNGNLRTMVLNDPSLLTAVGNDSGFSEVFAEPLKRFGTQKDLLVAISSSGRSRNILKAIKTARTIGMEVITFSAMDTDNPLRSMGDVNFYVPAQEYGHAESAHAALLHFWIDLHIANSREDALKQKNIHIIRQTAAS